MKRFVDTCRRRVFRAGEVIFRTGDPGNAFYLILAGLVDIVVPVAGKRERRLVTIRSGMSFGEFALVTEQPRSADARAVMDTVCYEVECDEVDESLRATLMVSVARELARRLGKEARELRLLGGA